jgi:hypothetical protein
VEIFHQNLLPATFKGTDGGLKNYFCNSPFNFELAFEVLKQSKLNVYQSPFSFTCRSPKVAGVFLDVEG